MSKLLSNRPIFLPHDLGAMPLRQARFHVFLIIFQFFWNLNALALDPCVQAMTPICLKIPSNLLHMELTRNLEPSTEFLGL